AVIDRPIDELVGDLPLVRWEGDEARLHDLWGELTADDLTPAERDRVTRAAAAVHRRRGRFDRAIDLARSVEAWSELTATLGEAVTDSVDGGLQADRLRRWRTSLPAALDDDPVVGLIDGLIERERDPTSAKAWALLDRAATRFEADDERRLALTALLQLGYLARIHGDTERLAAVMERLGTLAERHEATRPFLAFGQAWTALAMARSDLQLAAMESIAHEELPLVWRTTRSHLRAHALMSLGRPVEGLDHVPKQIERLPVAIPGALNTESQCLWFAGRPDEALRRRRGDLSDRYGARDLFIAGAWNAMMLAYAGDVPGARRALDVGISHLGEAPSALVKSQTAGVEILIQIAEGDEAGATAAIEFILELVPLGGGVGEQMLRNNVAIPYVLVPASRPFWDDFDVGPSQREAMEVIGAFASWRDGDSGPISVLHWPEPGVVAAQLPCRWAIELALAGLTADRHEGRRLAAWLCEHWGEPARAALRSWTEDEQLGSVAREVLASTPIPPDQPATLRLLGTTSVRTGGFASDSPDLRRERVRALLALLALRPDTTREQLAGALWPDLAAAKAAKNLRTTLSYVHTLLEPRRGPGDAPWYVRVEGHRVRLHPSLDIDLVRFGQLLDQADAAERAGRVGAALPVLLEAIELWDGDLAQDLDAEWLDLDRIHLRSRLVRAACRAAQLLVGTRDPARAAELARLALDVDPWNERAYLALADAYDELGDHTSARAVRARGEEAIGAPLDPRRAAGP
ncbi:MAG: BTAD domain-containing putative transcriptional regulator, partial [Actinomycetota bacterium]